MIRRQLKIISVALLLAASFGVGESSYGFELGYGGRLSIEKSASTPTIPEDALASEGWLVVKADTP